MADEQQMTRGRDVRIEGCRTLPQLFRKRCRDLGPAIAMREKVYGVWRDVTRAEYYDAARVYGAALMQMGLEPGDVVAIVSDPRKEWTLIDMAVQACRGLSNGIHPVNSSAQIEHICVDSKARFLVVENEEQLDKWLAVRHGIPGIRKVVVLDDKGLKTFSDPDVVMPEEFESAGRAALPRYGGEWDRRIDAGEAGDPAFLIYTSGTTGKPKGVTIAHCNALWAGRTFVETFGLNADSRCLVYLPLSHISERILSVISFLVTGSMMNFVEAPDTVFENITEVSPTYFFGVPRIWEKMYSSITLKLKEATWTGRKSFELALAVGSRYAEAKDGGVAPGPGLKFANWLAGRLVFDNIKVMLGLDKAETCLTGAAPVSPNLIYWFRAMGLPIYEVYGQTESTALISANRAGVNKIGSAGKPFKTVEVRIADDGEILARSQGVFQGYLNQPGKTAEAVVDGWLSTGDIGKTDGDGFLYVTGRKKDVIVTTDGRNITPSEIENELKFSPYVSDAVVIGDGREYLTCLIMIDYDNVSRNAQDRNIPFSDYASLCRAGEIRSLINDEVERVNLKFARETLRDFRLIERQLTAEDEELTTTMKLKRSLIEKKYAALIDDMYGRG